MKITFFGLGEAGRLIADDLVKLNRTDIEVHGYDPADIVAPIGLHRHDNPADAVTRADFVFALTASSDSIVALQQALNVIPANAVYADFSSSSPGLKKQLADIASARDVPFCDVALLAMVPGNGLATPAMVSGKAAARFAACLQKLGMPVTQMSDVPGDAAQHKLLRSVMMKGLAAVVIESMQAAQAAGCSEWLWKNICEEISNADHTMLERLVKGTGQHARRRLQEMKASSEMLTELGINPVMTTSTIKSLQNVLDGEVPKVPD